MAKRMVGMFFVVGLLVAVLFFVTEPAQTEPKSEAQPTAAQTDEQSGETGDRRKTYDSPPEMVIDPEKDYVATIVTNRGEIVLDLYPKAAPKTVNNFVVLSRDGFYNFTTFHRVIPNFMVQGGDPTGTGAGGPGYRFEDETAGNPHRHDKPGVLSMANAGPNTNGSQFFVTHVPTPWLDGKHTVFGQVRQGQDVVNAIRQGDQIKQIQIEEAGAATQPASTQPTTPGEQG